MMRSYFNAQPEPELEVGNDGELIEKRIALAGAEKTKNRIMESDPEKIYLLTDDPNALKLQEQHQLDLFKDHVIKIIGQDSYDVINPIIHFETIKGNRVEALRWTTYTGLTIVMTYRSSGDKFKMYVAWEKFYSSELFTVTSRASFENGVRELKENHPSHLSLLYKSISTPVKVATVLLLVIGLIIFLLFVSPLPFLLTVILLSLICTALVN